MQAEKKQKAREDLIRKIMEENSKRIEIEGIVSQMEQEELELINKLQNTQML